jgi:hypothetical protein
MRSQHPAINDREPVAPTRIAHQKRQHFLMQKALLRAGEANIRLMSESKRAATRPVTRAYVNVAQVDWVTVIARQPLHLAPPPASRSVLAPLAPLRPAPAEPQSEPDPVAEEPWLADSRPLGEEPAQSETLAQENRAPTTTLGQAGLAARLNEIVSSEIAASE